MPMIITHGGTAHQDEVLAIMLLLADRRGSQNQFTSIERREPTAQELNDPDVWVIDVGGRYEPSLHNFDHHQLGEDNNEVALSLVAKYILSEATYASVADFWPWLPLLKAIDNRGPTNARKEFKLPSNALSLTQSPIAMSLTKLVSERTRLAWMDGANLMMLMAEMGGVLLTELVTSAARMKLLEEKAILLRVLDGGVVVLDIRGVGTNNPGQLVEFFIFKKNLNPLFTISLPEQGRPENDGCVVVLRRDKHPGAANYDFSRLSKEPYCKFSHSNGFLAVLDFPQDSTPAEVFEKILPLSRSNESA